MVFNSLSKLFKLLENNDLGESIVDEFAILLGSWQFSKNAASGLVLLLENCYSEQKTKGLKLLHIGTAARQVQIDLLV